MKTKKYPSVTLCNAACAILMVALLILQFTPFWELGGQQISIGGYIWFPGSHEELTAHFQEIVAPDFKVDSLVLSSLIQLLLPAAGIGLLIYNRESIFVPVCTAVCGAGTIWSFLSKAAFRLGNNWYLYLVLGIILIVAAIASVYLRYKHPER